MTAELQKLPTKDDLIHEVADQAIRLLAGLSAERSRVDVCLTGGSVGIGVLAAMTEHERVSELDIERIHWWWGDERFVPSDSDDRNEKQAREALLDVLQVPEHMVHAFPASDEGLSLDEAAEAATVEFGGTLPFALTFLGVGPDSHVASLFPGHPGTAASGMQVIAVRDSPKPPPERLSLTFDALRFSERVWLVVAGDDKAEAVEQTLGRVNAVRNPSSAVSGQHETLLFADEAAASRV